MDKIAVDAMGGDFAPLEIVKGAVLAVRDFHVPVVLVGDKEQIVKVLKDNHADQEPLIEICHASQVIGMGEHPGMAFRKKKDASVSVGAKLVKSGECGALVAPGSTGAAVTAGLLGMGRVDGIERPAILTPIPNRKDGYTFLIDSGASAQPKPETLLQNALMGYVYAKKVWHIENPRKCSTEIWRRSCQPVFRIIEKIGGKRRSSGKAGGLSPETGIEKISCEAAGLCRIWRSAFDGD